MSIARTEPSSGRPRQRAARALEAIAPAERPLMRLTRAQLLARFESALAAADVSAGAHCIHELWMRGADAPGVDERLARLWAAATPRAVAPVPEWLPMRHIDWLPVVYAVCARFRREGRRGRHNLYLILLDYADSATRGPYGVYVGCTRYTPAERFDQHKAGLRAAGSVLKRGLEVLTGPVLHLQGLRRAQAEEIEEQLAEALRAEGLIVRGGH